MATATERMEIRTHTTTKQMLEQASELSGARSVSEYVNRVLREEASRVIEEHSKMTLPNEIFDQFITACENAASPNDALKAALKSSRERGIE